MAERRHGGETGVAAMQALRGDARLEGDGGRLVEGRRLGPAAVRGLPVPQPDARARPTTFSHRYPTPEQMREWVKEPVAYRFEYADGLKATMLLMNGLVDDFTFAARLKGRGASRSRRCSTCRPTRTWSTRPR